MIPRSGERERADFGNPLQGKKWQKIQDLFAKIIGANLTFFGVSGALLNQPSRVTGFCLEMGGHPTVDPARIDCVTQTLQKSDVREKTFHCPHGFHYHSLSIRSRQQEVGSLVMGPIQMGKREDDEMMREMCISLGVDAENFLDRAKEIKVFSYTGIHTVMDFLREMIESFVWHTRQREELRRLVPRLISRAQKTENFFSTVCMSELTHSLMEVASAVVGADSGSVLLIDPKKKVFTIKASRGIRAEIIENKFPSLKEGVAGWVVSRGRPFLIQKDVKDSVPQTQLNRPEIYSSMVVPITFRGRALGAVCLNSAGKNDKFNEDNLILLDQLSKLAGIALDRSSKG